MHNIIDQQNIPASNHLTARSHCVQRSIEIPKCQNIIGQQNIPSQILPHCQQRQWSKKKCPPAVAVAAAMKKHVNKSTLHPGLCIQKKCPRKHPSADVCGLTTPLGGLGGCRHEVARTPAGVSPPPRTACLLPAHHTTRLLARPLPPAQPHAPLPAACDQHPAPPSRGFR